MNMCAKRNADATSAQLEFVKAFIADSLTEAGKTSLASSESAWIRFQDLDCGFAADRFAGGSIAPLVYGECLSDRNLNRTRELAGEGQTSLSYAEADAQLNESYQDLIAALSEPRVEALTDVQLAWIEYRDRNCAYEADHSPTVTDSKEQCFARMSKLRAADLQQATEQNSL
nr:lysozyme inhibitor LprI family protein [cf. Phormidesmis sp. LEGE 11477]